MSSDCLQPNFPVDHNTLAFADESVARKAEKSRLSLSLSEQLAKYSLVNLLYVPIVPCQQRPIRSRPHSIEINNRQRRRRIGRGCALQDAPWLGSLINYSGT